MSRAGLSSSCHAGRAARRGSIELRPFPRGLASKKDVRDRRRVAAPGGMMRYRRDHKPRTRNRIIEKTSLGLRERGIGGLSIPDLMKLAGLTHGGFYNHFESREALVAASILFAMNRTTSGWA